MLNLNDIDQEWFEDQESHDAFLYTCRAALNLISISDQDIQMIDSDNEIYDIKKVKIVINGKNSEVRFDNVIVAGDEHDEFGCIYMNCEETKHRLESWTICKRQHVEWMPKG